MLPKSGQRPTAAALAALVVVRHVAAAALDSPGAATARPDATLPPNLDHWLALALECTLEGNEAPQSLKLWLERARGDREDAVLNQVDEFEQTVSAATRCSIGIFLTSGREYSCDNCTREEWTPHSTGSSTVGRLSLYSPLHPLLTSL